MNNLRIGIAFAVALLLCCAAGTLGQPPARAGQNQPLPSLVPDKPGTTPDYWCTWGAQNYASVETARDAMSHSTIAGALTEDHVFGVDGWARAFPKVHKDMYIVFDLGWDVPGGTEFDHARWKLGSQIVAQDKFPSCSGAPVERLRKLNELAKQAGWRGAGIWIAAQAYGDGRDGKMLLDADVEQFFRERLEWSHQAGIPYWKIDYGSRNNLEFRRMVMRLASSIAPELSIENARGSCPLNDEICPWEAKLTAHHSGEFKAWGDGSVLQDSVEIAAFSQTFRTYDITTRFSTETTLDRVAQMLANLSRNPDAKGILNAEDEPYIAAVLGTSMGIMRHPQWLSGEQIGQDYDPRDFRHRIDEVTRAVRWQRIAPAFAVNAAPVTLDSKRLDDSWTFRKGETWADWVIGKRVVQGAPARVARGIELAEVSGAEVPYVIAGRNPNGAVAIATLPRLDARRGYTFPLADVTLALKNGDGMIGVFGHYKSLTLRIPNGTGGMEVAAQDLASDSAENITSKVVFHRDSIKIPGKLIDEVGRRARTPGDVSDPGVVLMLVRVTE